MINNHNIALICTNEVYLNRVEFESNNFDKNN